MTTKEIVRTIIVGKKEVIITGTMTKTPDRKYIYNYNIGQYAEKLFPSDCAKIAQKLGVSRPLVRCVANGERWNPDVAVEIVKVAADNQRYLSQTANNS